MVAITVQETILDFLLFPFWWYTKGWIRLLRGIGRSIANRQRSLALLLWIANIFRPMYGQEDWQGKLISFFFRIFILIWRLVLFIVWLLCMGAVFLLYSLLPAIAIYGIMQNIS